jgi:hypothetical protein
MLKSKSLCINATVWTYSATIVLEYAIAQHCLGLVDEMGALLVLQVIKLLLGVLALGLSRLHVHLLDQLLHLRRRLSQECEVCVLFRGLQEEQGGDRDTFQGGDSYIANNGV